MGIAADDQRARNDVALFHHHLMGDAGASRIEIDSMLFRERLDLVVFLQIFRSDILNVVIDGENWLRWVSDFGRADLFEFWDNRAGVVMRHDVTRTD